MSIEIILISFRIIKALGCDEDILQIYKEDLIKNKQITIDRILKSDLNINNLDFILLTNLEKLELNNFDIIPKNINKNLKHLKLTNYQNHISRYYSDSLTRHIDLNFPWLKTLNLSNCGIRLLDYDTFKNLVLLEELDLTDNSIDNLPKNMLSNCALLKSLNLDFNYICEMEGECFRGLRNLEKLSLALHDEELLSGYECAYGQIVNLKKLSINLDYQMMDKIKEKEKDFNYLGHHFFQK